MPASPPEGLAPSLTRRLLEFCRYLRVSGLSVGSNQVADFLRALTYVASIDQTDFYFAAETTLVNGAEERRLFQEAFQRFWGGETGGKRGRMAGEGGSVAGEGEVIGARRMEEGGPAENGADSGRYSAVEVLRSRDFADMTEDELAQVRSLIADLPLRLPERRTRRYQVGRGRRPDFRRSLRASLRHDGEWLRWARRGRKRQPRTLVLLADISGSMARYSRVLLTFCYGLARGYQSGLEAFVFGTRLTRITHALNERTAIRALDQMTAAVPDWSGGTRIGESLRTFNRQWARRVLAREAAVLVISDGWDRGSPEILGREMARLNRLANPLIWLNPLLGEPGYRPQTRGIQAALPHIDEFLPVHNLESLEELAARLADLGAKRPGRTPAFLERDGLRAAERSIA